MTYQPPGGQVPHSVEVTRVRGGISPRAGAVAVAGVLAAVVWIGISGRPAPTAPAPERPGVAEAATASPSTTAEETETPLPVGPPSSPHDASPPPAVALFAGEHFSIVTTVGNRQSMTVLEPTELSSLSGTLRLPTSAPANEARIELAQLWRTVSHDVWVALATWDLSLESAPDGGDREYVLLDRTIPARPTLRNAPILVTRGYRITVRVPSGPNVVGLSVEIRVGPNRQLVGDDGIFGWPVVGQIRPDPVSRTRGLYNACRWDVGPTSARPGPGTDEANC